MGSRLFIAGAFAQKLRRSVAALTPAARGGGECNAGPGL
jgi:hypothetical protein